ncbi:hypothetical protein Zm00014a_012540 [Zea mays]|uniref:Uncharacterized protein n=1 Tax=Zea mays TaxID=4577 RepID=A0A3L6GBZ1_MAIZE|nr:hypothetical protein Zm00014a_012540 [Zea mays]
MVPLISIRCKKSIGLEIASHNTRLSCGKPSQPGSIDEFHIGCTNTQYICHNVCFPRLISSF